MSGYHSTETHADHIAAPEALRRAGLVLRIQEGGQDTPLVAQLKQVRADFVRAMDWFPDDPERDDTDRYDSDPRTLHFASFEPGTSRSLVASMRLTQVDSLEQSLSWEMLSSNADMQRTVLSQQLAGGEAVGSALDERATKGGLWDLTRLVYPLDDKADKEMLLGGLMEMCGAGLALTDPAEGELADDTLTWVFTATPTVKLALDFLGVENQVLSKGKVSAHDRKESYFCIVHPVSAFSRIQQNPDKYGFAAQHVENGLAKAYAL